MLTKMPVRQIIRRFNKGNEGTAAIEFAIILPVFLLLLFGTIEIAMVMFTLSLAEGGLREAARFGVTGQEVDPVARQAKILQIITDHTHGLIDISDANVQVTVYPDFTGDDTGPGTPGAGASNDVVFYRLNYEWQYLTPIFSVFTGLGNSLPMTATIAVRNEPYSDE